jgi:HK97 gp10 family phage protein
MQNVTANASMFKIGIDPQDIKAMERKIRRFTKDPSTQRRILKSSLQAGGKVVVKQARANAPTRTGALKKSIGSEVRHNHKGWYVTIGPRAATKWWTPNNRLKGGFNKPAFYAHMVEFGAKPHAIVTVDIRNTSRKVTLRHPGARPKPFLVPALTGAGGAPGRAIVKQASKRIEREAKKK